jgi:hypothetical protein
MDRATKLARVDESQAFAEWKAAIAKERADSRRAAIAFERAILSGCVNQFLAAVDGLFMTVDGWRLAMKRAGRLKNVSDDIQWEFLSTWVQAQGLRLKAGDERRSLASALRILLPRSEVGQPMTLYRGADARERKRRAYGFSWTRDSAMARRFAEYLPTVGWETVVLRTVASPDAILHARDDGEPFDEKEIIVDPFKLGRIEVVERIEASSIGDGSRPPALVED